MVLARLKGEGHIRLSAHAVRSRARTIEGGIIAKSAAGSAQTKDIQSEVALAARYEMLPPAVERLEALRAVAVGS